MKKKVKTGTWSVIANPKAGKGKSVTYLKTINHFCHNRNLKCRILKSSTYEIAYNSVIEDIKAGIRTFIAVGGDGTLNCVVNAVMSKRDVRGIKLCLIPCGSGNDFAKALNINDSPEKLLQKLFDNELKRVDVGKITCCKEVRFFINSFGIGLDAETALVASKIHFLRGIARYMTALVIALFKFRNIPIAIRTYNDLFRAKVLLMAVGNTRYCGGGFQLTPDAVCDDGLFDICLAQEVSFKRLFSIFPKLLKAEHMREKEVTMKRSSIIQVKSKFALPVYYDGEIYRTKPNEILSIYNLCKKLSIVV